MAPSAKTFPRPLAGDKTRGIHVGIAPGNGTLGSFATKHQSEDVGEIPAGEVDWSDTGLASSAPVTTSGLTGAQILEAATKSAFMRAPPDFSERGYDREDVAAETALRAWQELEKDRSHKAEITNPLGYISRTAASVVSSAANGHERAEDVRARKMFRQMSGDAEQEVGRSLTPAERASLQRKIVDEWQDNRHKPTAGCFTLGPAKFVDIEDIANLSDDQVQRHQNGGHLDGTGEDDMSTKDRRVLKREGWNTLAELSNLPIVANGSLTWRRTKAIRSAMEANESGVLGAAVSWNRGDRGPETDALFGPFGDLEEADKNDVARAFVRYGSYAHELWNSAVSTAGTRADS